MRGGKINSYRLRVNTQIRVPQVRLIDEEGKQLGIRSVEEGLSLAREKNLDLVEISPTSNPPVCKLLDYAKFRYEEEKRFKEARKKQKAGHVKEIRLTPRIGEHDLEIKIRHIEEFLQNKDKVRVVVFMRGREATHRNLGERILNKVKERLNDLSSIEQEQRNFGNQLTVIFSPKK